MLFNNLFLLHQRVSISLSHLFKCSSDFSFLLEVCCQMLMHTTSEHCWDFLPCTTKKNILGFSTGFKGYWTWTPEGRLSLNLSFAHASQESDKIPLHRIYLPEFGYLVWSHHGNNVISTEKQAWLVSGCSTLCFSTYCFSITSGTLIEAAISDFYR